MKIIPLEAVPNQRVPILLDSTSYTIEVLTRNDRLYLTIWDEDQRILANRFLACYAPLIREFVLIDLEGTDDPVYTGLGSRWLLAFAEESDPVAECFRFGHIVGAQENGLPLLSVVIDGGMNHRS